MFSESASIYDLVYEGAGKDYDAEAGHVLALIRQRLPEARTLLDVACGTGQHLARFARTLDCTGVDLDPDLLDVAAAKCAGVPFVRADMRKLDLDRQFDVVTCMHASVGYMVTETDLQAAVAAMARHVRPGGLLLVEMCFEPDTWRTDLVKTVVAEGTGITVVRMGTSARNGRVATLELHYLVGSGDAGITHLTEHHDLGLYTPAEYRSALAATGMTAEVLPAGPSGLKLLVGTAAAPRGLPGPVDGPGVAAWPT